MVKAAYLAETVFVIIAASALTLFFVAKNNNQFNFHITTPSLPGNVVPSPAPEIQEPQSTFWLSSDGTTNLNMKVTYNADKTKTYAFSVSPKNSTKQQPVFSKTIKSEDSITIPFNSWSPDNKYFFVKDVEGGITNYLVFKASGEAFANGQQYLNASEIFNLKKTSNILQEVTGWASPTLLLANTTTDGQAAGPSYWIEIPSKAVIQLSLRF